VRTRAEAAGEIASRFMHVPAGYEQAMHRYRLVVVDEEPRPQDSRVVPFAEEPSPGRAVELPGGDTVTISHVISSSPAM
jgi:hypothetical protein